MNVDPKKWMQYANSVFSSAAVPTEAIFVHGWGDLMEETADFSANLFRQYAARFVVVNGERSYDVEAPEKGYEFLKERLVAQGVPNEAIIPITPARHTREEADGFIRICTEKGIQSATVVSVPQHILRAYLTVLEVAKRSETSTKLYPKTLSTIDWEKPIRVAGLMDAEIEESTRLTRLVNECARIVAYRKLYEEGNTEFPISTPEEAIAYFETKLNIKGNG